MGSTAGTIVSYAKGSVALGNTFGTAIASPAFKKTRFTSDGLKRNYKTEVSKEVLNTFRRKNFRRLGIDAGGAIGSEFVFGNLDDWFESLLYSTWQRTPQRYNATADTQISDIQSGTGAITMLAASAGDENRVGTFAVGHLIRATGETTNAGNNFLKRATAATGTSVTVSTANLVTNTAPNAGYRLKAVGIEAPANGNIQTTTSGLAAGSVAAITGSGIDFTALGVVAGLWFKMSACPTAACNGWYRALSVTATRIECDRAPSGFATDTAAAAQIRLWLSDYIRDGTNAILWFDFERQLPQLGTAEYHYFISQMAKKFQLGATPQAITACIMEFLGSSGTTGTSRVAGATDVTADALSAVPRTGDMFDASNNVARVLLPDNTALVDAISSVEWGIDNNASGLPAIGNLGAARILRPAWSPSLTVKKYYDARTFQNLIEGDTVLGASSVFTDPLGTRAFIIDYPSCKLLQSPMDDIQTDGELGENLTFGAIENTTFGCQVQLMRVEEYA